MAKLNRPTDNLMGSGEIQPGTMNLRGLREEYFVVWPRTFFVTSVSSLQTSLFLLLQNEAFHPKRISGIQSGIDWVEVSSPLY